MMALTYKQIMIMKPLVICKIDNLDIRSPDLEQVFL